MGGLTTLYVANGKPFHQHGTRSVSISVQNGIAMNISLIVCDAKLPIVSVNNLETHVSIRF